MPGFLPSDEAAAEEPVVPMASSGGGGGGSLSQEVISLRDEIAAMEEALAAEEAAVALAVGGGGQAAEALAAEPVAGPPTADGEDGMVDDDEDFIIIDSGREAVTASPAIELPSQGDGLVEGDSASPTAAVETDPYGPPPPPAAKKPRVVLLGRRALAARRAGDEAKPPNHAAAQEAEEGGASATAATTAPSAQPGDAAAARPGAAAVAAAPAPAAAGTAAPAPAPAASAGGVGVGAAASVSPGEPSPRPPLTQTHGLQPRPRVSYPKPQPPRGPPPAAAVASAAAASARPPGVATHGLQQPVTKADWCSFNASGQRVAAPKRAASWTAGEACLPNQFLAPQHCPPGLAPQAVAVDHLGREFDLTRVVVNFANVGSTYGKRVLRRDRMVGSYLFDYEGVRRCVKYLTEKLRLGVIGVVYENFKAVSETGQEVWEVPKDIAEMCESIELAPRITGQQHRSADDEMTIKCAYRRNCRFLDNDNYMDWRNSMHDVDARAWLEHCQEFLQMRYFFDSGLGAFDTLDGNVPAAVLAMRPAAKRPRPVCVCAALEAPPQQQQAPPRPPPEPLGRPPSVD